MTRYRHTARSLPIALLRAREAVMGPVRTMLADSGVNEQKWRILRVLAEDGAMDQSLLAERAALQLPSLTRILHAMADQGLVQRSPDTVDKRRQIVTLLPPGMAILDAHAEQAAALAQAMEQRFGADNLNQLLDLLDRLAASQKKDTP